MIHLQCLFNQANYINGIDFWEIFQGSTESAKFTSCQNGLRVSVWWTLWHGGWFLWGPQVSTVGLTVYWKFLGLQKFRSFKGFKCMGHVQNFKLFYQTFSEGERWSFFRISWLESLLNALKISPVCRLFLFHTNVVKHEKEGQ